MCQESTPEPPVADTESGARGAIYGLLARLFEEPDPEIHAALAAGEFDDHLASLVRTAGLAGLEVPGLRTDDDHDLLCARFNDIFAVGYPDPPVPRYESSYAAEGEWESINLDLARAYDYFGAAIDERERDHHDHLVLELEFAGYLARLAAVEDRPDLEQARKDFLDRHLLGFAEDLESAIAAEVETGIYDDLVSFLAAFVEADRRALAARSNGSEVTTP
jgi:DMSO reductase family type II enzyme chaperone